jgi:general secretion pathway protein A
MLNDYFHFSCSPFQNTFDQRFLYLSSSHKEVIQALLYFVTEKKGFAMVSGDVGTGKTMIVHSLLEKLPQTVEPILIPYPARENIEILRFMGRALKLDVDADVLQLFNRLKAKLEDLHSSGRQVVLIVDEAHLLPVDALENLRLLSNIGLTEDTLIQILLVGQNELEVKLHDKGMRQLFQRIDVNRILSPMNLQETVQYVDHRLKIAGSSFEACFDSDCKDKIYRITGGVPRIINSLCDNTLLACMNKNGSKVTKRILRETYRVMKGDIIPTPEKRTRRLLSNSLSQLHYKSLMPIAAAASVIVFFAIGFTGLRVDSDQYLKGSTHISNAPKDLTGEIRQEQAPTFEAQRPNHSANQATDFPRGEIGPAPAVTASTEAANRAEAEKPVTVRAPEPETATQAPIPPGSQGETTGASDYFKVVVQKGENLTLIATRWFPENPLAGKRMILSANPYIHDEDLIVTGETLQIPKKK